MSTVGGGIYSLLSGNFKEQASIGRVEKVGIGWVGVVDTAMYLRWGFPASSHFPLVGGRGETKELQSCSCQVKVRALGEPP